MNTIGASLLSGGGCFFKVWAPEKAKMNLHLVHPVDATIPMVKNNQGYFELQINNTGAGTRYFFQPEEKNDFPDPASHYQPEGVHGASEVVDHGQFRWKDQSWKGIPFEELILYELHVGTFSEEGTFSAVIPYLDDLVALGVNGIELMPVAQFPGARNWGYDGVFPYAIQNSYGGPEGLKQLVNACHQKGLAVYMDVVYNHLGPEGNYFKEFAPYFTDQYRTPWGDAINYDGEWSDGVRDYFSENPLHWMKNYHLDGLRCDAIHAVFDGGAVHFWELTHRKIKSLEEKLDRHFHLIAESDLNSPKVVQPPGIGGYGFRAQWLDDFHHALYVLVDKKGKDRYRDFGRLEQLAKAFTDGFVHSGEYVSFRKRRHGASSAGIPGDHFVVFNQNHDQIGNRVLGERLCHLVDIKRLKIAAAAVLLSPYVPMLFMGEEYADAAPFFYFVSHSEQELIKAVREGRKDEFKNFKWTSDPPDPQDEDIFKQSKLNWRLREKDSHKEILQWHKRLIELRKTSPALSNLYKDQVRANISHTGLLEVQRKCSYGEDVVLCLFNFSEESASYTFPGKADTFRKILNSEEEPQRNGEEGTASAVVQEAGEIINVSPWTILVYKKCEGAYD